MHSFIHFAIKRLCSLNLLNRHLSGHYPTLKKKWLEEKQIYVTCTKQYKDDSFICFMNW